MTAITLNSKTKARLLRFVFVFCVILFGPRTVIADTLIKNIRFGDRGDSTRVVLDLSGAAEPTLFLLANPARVVIDFSNADYQEDTKQSPKGVVAGYRHGLFDSQTYRLVLDLKERAVVSKSFSIAPSGNRGHRYVIDLKSANVTRFSTEVTRSRAALAKKKPVRQAYTPPKRTSGKKLIVIDPGHGGLDPGTIGVLGVNEETIVLNIAKEIKRILEASGRYDVHLTRSTDVYLRHRRRFQIARDLNADLFISIHADSIANSKVRGGTVYTLNEAASDKEAARLAARENKSDVLAGVDLTEVADDVSGILIDLQQRQTMNMSAEFAGHLVTAMREEVRMHKRGHRFASLLVLKSPDVASVLLETGYLTNKEDARMLNSRSGRRKIANGVLKGIDRFFKAKETVAR